MVSMVLEDVDGKPVLGEAMVRRDTVELRCQDHLVAIADRDAFREWVEHPEGEFVADEMAWLGTERGVFLAVKDLCPWSPVSGSVMADLRELL